MLISIIVAAAENGVIGNQGKLPWRMPSDLKRFRQHTMGKPIVMGRKTFQSLPKPLDGRDNIVVTRDAGFRAAGVETATSLEAGIELARAHARRRGCSEIMIIGGAEIYAAAMAIADRIYLTRVHAVVDGDARFSDPIQSGWEVESEETIPRGPSDEHGATLIVYRRAKNQPVQMK